MNASYKRLVITHEIAKAGRSFGDRKYRVLSRRFLLPDVVIMLGLFIFSSFFHDFPRVLDSWRNNRSRLPFVDPYPSSFIVSFSVREYTAIISRLRFGSVVLCRVAIWQLLFLYRFLLYPLLIETPASSRPFP